MERLDLAIEADVESVREIYNTSIPSAEVYNFDKYLILVQQKVARIYVQRESGKIITIAFVEIFAEKRVAWLAYLATHEQYRNNGAGLAMLKHVITQIRTEFPGTVLYVEADEPEAFAEERARLLASRRLNWYETKGGGQPWHGIYHGPSFSDPAGKIPYRLLSFPQVQGKTTHQQFVLAAICILTKSSYALPSNHPLVTAVEAQA